MSADLTFGIFERQTTGLVILAGEEVVLVADCTVTEDHGSPAQVTAYPRERRGQASDHIQAQQQTLSTQIIVSATPLLDEADPGRPIDAYERLRRLQTEGTPVTLITSLKVYEEMGLVSCTTPRSAAVGEMVELSCSWVKMEAIDTRTVSVPASILAAIARPSGKGKDNSKDQAKPPDAKTQKARKKTVGVAIRDMGAQALDSVMSD